MNKDRSWSSKVLLLIVLSNSKSLRPHGFSPDTIENRRNRNYFIRLSSMCLKLNSNIFSLICLTVIQSRIIKNVSLMSPNCEYFLVLVTGDVIGFVLLDSHRNLNFMKSDPGDTSRSVTIFQRWGIEWLLRKGTFLICGYF